MSRWVSLNQLADETGLAVRTLQYIRAQEPSVLVTRQKGKSLEYKQPDCAINLRTREAEKARREATPTLTLDEARTRKALAEAEMVEIEVAKARSEVVSVEDTAKVIGTILDRLCSRLRALPVRLAHLGELVEEAAKSEAELIIAELSEFSEEVLPDPTEEAAKE
jgi:phage terminase Nu1 subunit (DNA packaging protein)